MKNLCSSPRGRYCPLLQTTTLQLAGDTSARSWWPGRISGNTFLFCSSERSQRNRFLKINVKEFCHSLHHFAERTALKKKKFFPKNYFGVFPATAHKRFSSVCKRSPPQLSRCLVRDRFSPPASTDRSGSPPGQSWPVSLQLLNAVFFCRLFHNPAQS